MALLPTSRKKSNKTTDMGNGARTIIDRGTSITGNIVTEGNLLIDGELKGDIKSKGKVVLGESSRTKGNLVSQQAVIEGEIRGDIYVLEQLVLREKAVVRGDIFAASVQMEAGAKHDGRSTIGTAPEIPKKFNALDETLSNKLQLEEAPVATNGVKH